MRTQRQLALRIITGVLLLSLPLVVLQCGGGVSQNNSGLSCEYPGTWLLIDDYRYDSANASPTAVTSDAAGNVFVAGTATVGATQHWLVRKAKAGTNAFEPHPVDDFIYADGNVANPTGIAADRAGNIFVSGFGSNALGKTHWLLRKSADGGAHWITVDDYSFPAGGEQARALAVTADTSGNVFAAGIGLAAGFNNAHWLLRWATQPGTIWQSASLDDFTSAPGQVAQGNAIAADTFGNVFVAGEGASAKGEQRWIVRRSSLTAASAVSDNYLYPGGTGSSATGIAVDANGTAYSVGWGTYGGSRSHWLVRKALRGTAWRTVDDFYYPGSSFASPSGVTLDSGGAVYVTGMGMDRRNVGHWVTRRSLDGGMYWQTLDDYLPTNSSGAEGNSVTTDRLGNLYVAGYAMDGVATHWQVRKLLCR